jgi:hypothetical protein
MYISSVYRFLELSERNFVHVRSTIKSDQVKEDEMGVTCGAHGKDEKCVQNFGQSTRRDETTRKT